MSTAFLFGGDWGYYVLGLGLAVMAFSHWALRDENDDA